MNSKLLFVLVASVMGVVGGLVGSNLVKPAYAASTVIVVKKVALLIWYGLS